jgi:hypothetical protein
MIGFSHLLTVSCSNATEKEEIRTIAENFVAQICSNNPSVILQSYQMTDEFYTIASDTANIVKWASEIDNVFGQLENIVNSEIVEHEKNLRSVYLYYQGTKRPAKIWVTFSGTDIAGIHWEWQGNGNNENVFSEAWNVLFGVLFGAYCFIYSIACIFWGERIRKIYVQKLRSDYQYQNEHFLSSYTESQNPSWCFLLCHGITLFSIIMILALILLTPQIVSTIGMGIIIVVAILVILLCELLPLLVVGFFIEVNDQYLTIRMGTFRLQILRLELKNIQSVETVSFRPIRDFGGWGIRMGNNGLAYFMSGTEGVQITITNKQKYIIGSDIPDRLAKVVLGTIHSIKNSD